MRFRDIIRQRRKVLPIDYTLPVHPHLSPPLFPVYIRKGRNIAPQRIHPLSYPSSFLILIKTTQKPTSHDRIHDIRPASNTPAALFHTKSILFRMLQDLTNRPLLPHLSPYISFRPPSAVSVIFFPHLFKPTYLLGVASKHAIRRRDLSLLRCSSTEMRCRAQAHACMCGDGTACAAAKGRCQEGGVVSYCSFSDRDIKHQFALHFTTPPSILPFPVCIGPRTHAHRQSWALPRSPFSAISGSSSLPMLFS